MEKLNIEVTSLSAFESTLNFAYRIFLEEKKSISDFIRYLRDEIKLSVWNMSFDVHDHDREVIVSFCTYIDGENKHIAYDVLCELVGDCWICSFIEVTI